MFRRRLIHNISRNNEYRAWLRDNPTPAERLLWKCLQNSRLDGKKFRRQHGIGPFIVDFYCPEFRVAVELDGAKHRNIVGGEEDQRRDEFLKRFGVRLIRFENRLVFENLELVLDAIRAELKTTALEPPPA